MAHWYESQPTELDRAYYERNALVAALSKLYPSHVAQHPPDPNWDPAWENIVIIETPTGQLSWHMHLDHMHMFAHLSVMPNTWDGHTTVEKYERLAALCARDELGTAIAAGSVDVSKPSGEQ